MFETNLPNELSYNNKTNKLAARVVSPPHFFSFLILNQTETATLDLITFYLSSLPKFDLC